jgi:HTH-type transcriptional regulator/antitoxin HipB
MSDQNMKLRSPGDIGLIIQQARLAHGISQTALADSLGMSQRAVSEIESGKPTIYMRKVFDLLSATGVELSAHWEEEGDGR